jgi:hypothetical protein
VIEVVCASRREPVTADALSAANTSPDSVNSGSPPGPNVERTALREMPETAWDTFVPAAKSSGSSVTYPACALPATKRNPARKLARIVDLHVNNSNHGRGAKFVPFSKTRRQSTHAEIGATRHVKKADTNRPRM